MIVRIATEGQYELTDSDAEVFQDLDNEAVAACQGEDEEQFHQKFTRLLDFIRQNGQLVAEDRLESSDAIVPPPDSTLEEAKAEFTGDGLIPG